MVGLERKKMLTNVQRGKLSTYVEQRVLAVLNGLNSMLKWKTTLEVGRARTQWHSRSLFRLDRCFVGVRGWTDRKMSRVEVASIANSRLKHSLSCAVRVVSDRKNGRLEVRQQILQKKYARVFCPLLLMSNVTSAHTRQGLKVQSDRIVEGTCGSAVGACVQE